MNLPWLVLMDLLGTRQQNVAQHFGHPTLPAGLVFSPREPTLTLTPSHPQESGWP